MSSAQGHPFTSCFSGQVLMENRHACSESASRTDHRPGWTEHRAGHVVLPGPMGIRPPDGVPTRATLPELRLTSLSAWDSSSRRLSPQPTRPGWDGLLRRHRGIAWATLSYKIEEIFGWMKMIGPWIRAGSPVRSAHIKQVIWSARRTIWDCYKTR